jgi:hypothetical protein
MGSLKRRLDPSSVALIVINVSGVVVEDDAMVMAVITKMAIRIEMLLASREDCLSQRAGAHSSEMVIVCCGEPGAWMM